MALHATESRETDVRPILYAIFPYILFLVTWIQQAIKNVQKDDLADVSDVSWGIDVSDGNWGTKFLHRLLNLLGQGLGLRYCARPRVLSNLPAFQQCRQYILSRHRDLSSKERLIGRLRLDDCRRHHHVWQSLLQIKAIEHDLHRQGGKCIWTLTIRSKFPSHFRYRML